MRDGPETRLLIERADAPRREFLALFHDEFLQALGSGDREKASAIATTTLTRHNDPPRPAIEELFDLVNVQHGGREKKVTVNRSGFAVKMVAGSTQRTQEGLEQARVTAQSLADRAEELNAVAETFRLA